jgi:O-acetylhomoserine/O-acetylserine sulfhydrylase-like pyridoxal-dependent enzyme
MAKQFKPETLCVQAGWTPKKGEPRVLPIYQSTTFKYDTSEQMARLFDFIPACKIQRMTPLPPKSPLLKVV